MERDEIMDRNEIFDVSKLGFGLMRLPEKDGEIDHAHVCRMVDKYMEAGLNYFDTAYIYPESESVLGAILKKNHVREKVNIAKEKLTDLIIACNVLNERINTYEDLLSIMFFISR